ncbi:unnamed protein product [Phyllotreta striolata]|uniref:Uncharacterized protein n=1 Tax=Phyllotreta striolata TaxID=444603 RepID=A0A9N9TEA7_PHYSR|nr:unnamed protein product [Phyllotreta striolata]
MIVLLKIWLEIVIQNILVSPSVFLSKAAMPLEGLENLPHAGEIALLRLKSIIELTKLWIESVIEILKAFPHFLTKKTIPPEVIAKLVGMFPALKSILQ